MARKVIKFTPDEMGYKDRGKMKWQGLILSDHTEALKKNVAYNEPPKPKVVMNEIEITSVLQLAYLRKVPVNIQRNVLINGNLTDDLIAMINGYSDDKVILKLKNGKLASAYIEDIRNVEFGDVNEWYEKY